MKALALVIFVALALGVVASSDAQDKPRPTREEALRDLTSPDVEARRLATAWLGELATPADLPALFGQLRDTDDLVRALTENSIWQTWSRSGDDKVDALFKIGVAQMNQGQAESALDTFTEIIKRKPEFAEGWNKRATIYFLIGEYDKSLADCDEVIKRNPQHWGALSGYGQIYMQLDRPEQALGYFQRALAVNPNLQNVENMVQQLKQLMIEKRRGTI
ncbi:MAG TPA: tetratricopeptide repeat protein [Candidatus Eisenbacteria bacterium]|nr:tetratricopeptide repeat protein [Candidatus Eisenbacteria bacterium]